MDMYNLAKVQYDRLKTLEAEAGSLSVTERLSAMAPPLLSWYKEHARILPWREDKSPYRVWVSEIMLQQTRVEAVKPYFERFMEHLPDVKSLAEAEEERLLKLWEGLGYYSRARNLKKAAVIVMEEYGGVIPADYEKLLKLPGIGSYTAGAIASIAFSIPVPAVDGNVLRVISRVCASREDILKSTVKKRMENDLKSMMYPYDPGLFNQGLIEIGAMVCVPNGRPKCEECPLDTVCLAKIQGLTGEIPFKSPKKQRRIEEKTILLLEYGGQTGIRKREDSGLLASLYEFPGFPGHLKRAEVAGFFGVAENAVEPLAAAKHIFSHVEWQMVGYRVKLERTDNMAETACFFVTKEEIKSRYPLPNAYRTYTKLVN